MMIHAQQLHGQWTPNGQRGKMVAEKIAVAAHQVAMGVMDLFTMGEGKPKDKSAIMFIGAVPTCTLWQDSQRHTTLPLISNLIGLSLVLLM